MVPIQNHSLSLRCPFKHNTKPAVSVADLLTPNPVLCASTCSFTVSLSVCLACPSSMLVCQHIMEQSLLFTCDKNRCRYEGKLVQPHINRSVEISMTFLLPVWHGCTCLVVQCMELGSVMKSFSSSTFISSLLSLGREKLVYCDHQGVEKNICIYLI